MGVSCGYQRRHQRQAWIANAAAAATRILCTSTGHYPHLSSWEPVQLATARVPWSRDNFPGRAQGMPQAVAMSPRALPLQAHAAFRIPYPSLSTAWGNQCPLISHSFNPLLSGWRTDTRWRPTCRGRAKTKAEPQELCEQRKEREISPWSLKSNGLNLHNQVDLPCISGIAE